MTFAKMAEARRFLFFNQRR